MPVAAITLLLYTFVCTCPGIYQPLAATLDDSWMFALNRLAWPGSYLFGRDVAFSYGPLGFLLAPRQVGSGWTVIVAEVFWCLIQVLQFSSAVWKLRNSARTLLLFSVAFLALVGLGLWIEYRFLFAVGTFALLSLEKTSRAVYFAVVAGLLASIGLEIKWSLGLSALSVVAGSWLVLMAGARSPASRKVCLGGVLSLVLSLLIFNLAFLRSPANVWKWIRLSAEVTGGYSSAMSMEGPGLPLALAAASAICLGCLYLLLSPAVRLYLWIFVGALFLAFKEGFVRQDGHRTAYFLLTSTTPVILLFAPNLNTRDRGRLGFAFLVLCSLSIVHSANYQSFPAFRWPEFRSLLLLEPGVQNLRRLASPTPTLADLHAATIRNLKPSALPPSWEKRFQDLKSTVSILPSDLSIAAANQLEWQPATTLQLYSAYTSVLDAATAAALADHGATYLIISYDSIDARNLILDTPLTWRSVMAHYRVLDNDKNARRVLLVREPHQPERTQGVALGLASMDQWVPVRDSNKLTYVSLDVRHSLFGKVSNVLYHVPPIYIETARRDGRIERYRLITATAISGILINYLPTDYFDLEEFFERRSANPVVRFRLVGAAQSPYFEAQYSWLLLESAISMTPSDGSPKPPAIPEIKPTSGTGLDATVEITASDPKGFQNLRLVQVLINREPNGAGACYASYEVATDRLWLIANAGSGSAGFGRPGEKVTLTNSQCEIQLNRAFVHSDGNVLTLRMPIRFNSSFVGTQHFYVYAMNRSGLATDWTARAQWKVE